ncbi:MAG: hypothetical protein U1E97_07150 [Alphaproteobacteria bacterium]
METYQGRDGTADDDLFSWGAGTILGYGGFTVGFVPQCRLSGCVERCRRRRYHVRGHHQW